jgi:ABC-type spermidine/putrescine transport system permease subunit I
LMGGGKTLFVGPLISNYFLFNQDIGTGAAFTCLSGIALGCALIAIFIVFQWVYIQMTRRR